jgi:hypothetical protein
MQTQFAPIARNRRTGRRLVALALAATLAVPAAASATPTGDTKYDSPGASGFRTGDTPAEIFQPRVVQGDTKFDAPGAARAPRYEAPPIQVVRPETTIVRDVNDELPIALAAGALVLALAGAAVAVQRTGGVHLRRTH